VAGQLPINSKVVGGKGRSCKGFVKQAWKFTDSIARRFEQELAPG